MLSNHLLTNIHQAAFWLMNLLKEQKKVGINKKFQITKKHYFLQAITNVVVDCSTAVDGQILKAKPFINLFVYEERQEDTKRVIALSKK